MAALLDNVRFSPTAGGTTDWTYSSAVTGYQSPAAAGVVNGVKYKYFAISADATQWEIGEGAYNTTAPGTLPRTTVLYNSAGTTSKINFSAAPTVAIVALAEDLISVERANNFTATQQAQARANIGIDNAYFSASLSANQSGLTNAAYSKCKFDSKLSDPFGWYDNVTNFRFQPTIAGYYRINASVQGDGTSVTEVDVDIYKNGSDYARSLGLASGVANSGSINKIVYFNGSTDYAEIFASVYGSGTLVFLGGAAPIRTWFEAQLVSA